MQWLQSMFGSEGSPVVQYIVIFVLIFAVLAGLTVAVRRLTGGRGLSLPGRDGQRVRQPRLGVVDVYELDRQRQLILLRRDNVEHLLLVGGPNDVVVERNIQRGQRLPADLGPRPETAPPPLPEPARPEVAAPAAAFAMPVVVPSPVPGSRATPPVTHPLDASALGPDDLPGDPPDEAAPSPARPSEPPAEGLPETPAKRALRRATPPTVSPRPEAASERAPAVPAVAVPERRAIDPAVLSDMARQLQTALARPASAVAPAPAARPAPPAEPPRPPAAPPAPSDDAAPPPPAIAPAPAPAAPPAPPAPDPRPRAEPPRQAPSAPPPGRPVDKPADTPAAPATAFSVEEIEAEFARLLGRPLDKRG